MSVASQRQISGATNAYALGGAENHQITDVTEAVIFPAIVVDTGIQFSSVQFSSVQFAKINAVLSAKHFRTTTQ